MVQHKNLKQGIHHTQLKQAEANGFTLSEVPEGIRAFWPAHGIELVAPTALQAIQQMREAQDNYDERLDIDPNGIGVDNTVPAGAPDRNSKGVPFDGAQAYREKFTAGDCPFSSETEDEDEYANFEKWNEDWDAAADEAEPEEKGGSVVKDEYRARYAERGHPTHCGDDLANILNNLCLTSQGIDLPRFEAICNANGVSLAKYNRTNNGWQGRLRMTGRNLLARRVYEAGGVLKTPIEGAEPEYRMSQEWMVTRKFAKKNGDNNAQAEATPEE
jgi:hypothetical protein